MFKYFLIVIFVVWCQTQAEPISHKDVVLESLPHIFQNLVSEATSTLDPPSNGSEIPDECKCGNVNIKTQNNVNVGQQVLFIYVEGSRAQKLKNRGNYLVTPGVGAHKLYLDQLSWAKARQACVQEGGHLAIINSQSEEEVLLRILKENNVDEAWLGLHDLYQEGEWVTVTDVPLEDTGYSKWASKYANDNGQNCAALVSEGGLDNLQCDKLVSFFCEIPM
ncbi:hemolymph lipopolysaccharide-binding protein-like [Pseudomyrmex gracilis]|uniref:hemolymph lipopolysaccharide-binding protein-like n=1 Tax=Pseudomyrmex gracilis TaxID=219809 RepID=UPI000994BF3A|nr:hemolymph lipopolysaccharide-binding protein-like [Pseudomyrmex gracilis]